MTRLERKQQELERLYQFRQTALRNNDVMWLAMNRSKIDILEKEIIAMKNEACRQAEEARKERVSSLRRQLENKGEEVKDRFYVGMLRISMLADAVNEACEEVRDMMKNELNAVDFTLRKDVDNLTEISKKIAAFVCATGHPVLEDCIVNDDKFVDCCMRLATKHITSKLKIKTKI